MRAGRGGDEMGREIPGVVKKALGPSRMRPSLSQHRAVLAAVNTAARGRAFLRAGRDEETARRPNKETPMGLNARYGGMANEGSGGASRCLSPCARAGRRQTTASRYPCHPMLSVKVSLRSTALFPTKISVSIHF